MDVTFIRVYKSCLNEWVAEFEYVIKPFGPHEKFWCLNKKSLLLRIEGRKKYGFHIDEEMKALKAIEECEMTKVSEQILEHIQEILDIKIPKDLHPLVEKIVRILAMQVGSDEAVTQILTDLEFRVKRLEMKNELSN
jgi:hypothetical protein